MAGKGVATSPSNGFFSILPPLWPSYLLSFYTNSKSNTLPTNEWCTFFQETTIITPLFLTIHFMKL